MAIISRIVFMGSPTFAVPILESLAKTYPVTGVITQPDRPAGRGRTLLPPPVKLTSQILEIPFIQPIKLNLPEVDTQLKRWNPELIVVAAYGKILPNEVLDIPKFGCINVHASLLPRWRGAAPIQASILAGDAVTGVTIMKMDSGVDTGPIISQRATPIDSNDTTGTLFEKLASLGAELLVESLPRYLSNELQPQLQPNEGVSYATLLKKEDGLLDFDRPAALLVRQIRAFNPWPGAFMICRGQILKIHRASIGNAKTIAGKRFNYRGWPAVGTSDELLILEEIQASGKKSMSGPAFLVGAREWEEQ